MSIRVGIDSTSLAETLRNQVPTAYAQDLFGTTMTFETMIAFVGTDIDIVANMIDEDGAVTTVSTTVATADYTGDYFGFVTRARARNYLTDPTPEGRGSPWVMDYVSFSIEPDPVPEPAVPGLLAMVGGAFMFVRRRTGFR